MIRASFPPPLSAFGDPKVEGTIHVDDVPEQGALVLVITRTGDGRGASILELEAFDVSTTIDGDSFELKATSTRLKARRLLG